MKLLIYIFSLGVLVASCTPKPIDINVAPAESKLVIFSHLIPDDFMIISVTRSFSALQAYSEDQYTDLLVTGAKVNVSYEGQVFDFYELSPGFYASYTEVQEVNGTYHLQVSHNGDTIRSSTQIKAKVDFNAVTPLITETATDTTVELRMQFSDIEAEENFYLLNVYKKNQGGSEFDNVNFFENGSNVLAGSFVYTDNEFNSNFDRTYQFPEINRDDTIAVTLSNISGDYYEYLNQKLNNGSLFTELNLEPFSYPTNIEGGYGFFNAHFPDVKVFDLNEY